MPANTESIRNVALAGATGNLGPSILQELINAKYNVTVLTREGSTHKFPAGVTVKAVNYDSIDSLKSALQGQQGLVSTLGSTALGDPQIKLIQAAVAAGVQRILPSEFGCNLDNAEVKKLPVFAPKLELQKQLDLLVQQHPNVTYTLVRTGPFLDWALKVGFMFDIKNNKAKIFDSGDQPFSATTLATIGKAVAQVFAHPDATKNKAVYVHDAVVTQNQLVKLARTASKSELSPTKVESAKVIQNALDALQKGDITDWVWFDMISGVIFGGEKYGAVFGQTDNQKLGIPMMSEKEIEQMVNSVVKA